MNQQLEELKSKILGFSDSDTVQTRTFIQIMREVGGYEQFINMPLPAIKEVYEFLKWESKQFEKKLHKGKR